MQETNEIINDTEIIVVGMRRSGNHAVINWLVPHYKGNVCFRNNCFAGKAPFLRPNRASSEYARNSGLKNIKDKSAGKRDCLIYSYEDLPFREIFTEDFKKNHDRWVGRSKKQYIILIFRDPFNLLASRLAQKYRHNNKANLKGFLHGKKELWKIYAKEFLGETDYLGENKILVNFNRWCSDKGYRENIAKKLEFELNDFGFNRISKYGKSSFAGTKFEDIANERKILERWKIMMNDAFYRDLIGDEELIELSNRIFGEIIDINEISGNKKYSFIKQELLRFELGLKPRFFDHLKRAIGRMGRVFKKYAPRLYAQIKSRNP